ncbi:MAG: glycosyltransferase family protein [Actinomycetes bacterium]
MSSVRTRQDARLARVCLALSRTGLPVEVLARAGAVDPAHRVAAAMLAPWRARGRVLVILDPDLSPSATLVRLVRRRRLVVDVSEDYLALLADRSWATGTAGVVARAVARTSTFLASRADLTVVADEHVPPHRARHRLVVRNLPDASYLPEAGEPEPSPRAVYVGDVRTSRGLRTMLTAIEGAPGWTLDLVGPVAAADHAWVAAWQGSSPAAGRVRWHGRLPLDQAWAVARGAWVGLALLEDTPAFRAAVPGKLYEYLGAGLAVLTTPLPRMARLVERSGAGRTVADAAEASDTLRRWLAHPDRVRGHREAARRWANAWRTGPSPYDDLTDAVSALAGPQPKEAG